LFFRIVERPLLRFLAYGDFRKSKLDKKTIYSKTGKGVLEIKNKAGKLSKDLVKVLTLVDGKSTVADLMAKAKFDDAEMDKAITQLSAGGYIKEFANTSTGVSPGGGGAAGGYVDDLDFTSSLTSSSAKSNPYQSAQTEWRQRESADRAKAEQDAKKKRELEEQAKKEQAGKQAREEAGRLAKVESERKAKEAAAHKMREEGERKAKIEAEAMAQTTRDLQKVLEAERKALEESERKKQEEAARRGKEEAEKRARDEAERKAREEEERKRKEADDRRRREEEERKRKEDEERKRKEDEERKRREDEERRKREEEERRKREEEERKRKEEEERKRKEDEERRKREEEERRKREEEERKRKEEEERKRKEEEERKRREDEERRRKEEEEARKRQEEEERKRKEEEERKRKEEEEARKRQEEEERKRKEEEERKRKEEEERRIRREEEDRRRQEEDDRRRKEDEETQERERGENERRRGEEDRLRREEDEVRRREDEERRGREEEESRRRRDEEDERRRRDDEDSRRREEEESARRREEEDRKRREDEERSRAAAPAAAKSDMPEFDLSGLKSMEDRIAAEFEKQQDALRKREEEEERRREQDEQARLAIERAEREEEARQEAERREAEDRERRERMEQERAERESRERKRQEEKEQRIKEAEERKIAAAHERQRQEEMKVESERRSREEALVGRRKEQEERDRKRAEVESLKKSKAIRSPVDRAKPFIIGIVVVLGALIGGVQLIPMNSYIPSVERLATEHIKEPVTIGSMKVSILSGFSMNLENVRLGTTQDVKIDRVTLSPELGSVFGSVKVVRKIDIDSVTVAQEALPRLPKWMDAALADKSVQVDRVSIRNIKVESTAVPLPNFDADLKLNEEGGIQHARLSDGKIDIDLTPRNNEVEITVSANKGWVSPLGPKVEFTDFSAKAVASHNQIRVSEFSALLYGGAAKGTATINFGGPWSLEGEISTERINLQEMMPAFTSAAKSSGQLESRFRYSMQSPELASLFNQPRVDGNFTIRKGDLDGVDLVRALQMGGRENVQGGATRFEEITGTMALANERFQFRNIRLASGLLSATGGFEVAPSNDISGRTFVELKSQAAQIRGNFNINGSLKAIVLKPN